MKDEYKASTTTLTIDNYSRYFRSILFEVEGSLFFNTLELSKLPNDIPGTLYTIPPEEEFRPDLTAIKFYEEFRLWWMICYANNITDPFTEFTVGLQIKIPSKDEVLNIR